MKGEYVRNAVPPTLPGPLARPKMSKGVQHSKDMSLPKASANPVAGKPTKGVQHSKGMSLPPARHSFAEANGGIAGRMEGRLAKDDVMRHRGRKAPY